jgi:hypothetical protein
MNMQLSTQVRWKSFGISLALFCIALLESGSTWQISLPPAGSSRTKTSTVGGGGMSNGTVATFRFGTSDGNTWNGEGDIAVTAGMGFWAGTIAAPVPDGWSVGTGRYAWIEWDDGLGVKRDSTGNHTITN